MAYDKKILRDFAERWQGKGYEKGETQQFWLQALRAIGYPHVDDVLFEHHLPSGGFIDVWIRDANVLIEQKSIEVDLDKPEPRQGELKTPLQQALDYVDELPRPEQPRYVVTCNFGTFRVYDRDKWSKSQLADNAFEFTLEEFAEHPEYMSFIIDPDNSRLEKEKQVSIKAGELIGKLYDKMREGYIDPDSDEAKHALNVLCVRLVFCLYCEDADLFVKDAFYNYLRTIPASQFRVALKRLFKALDTEQKERDPYDEDVKTFPYVNGGLFREETEVPNFTEDMKWFLLDEVSAPVDWSQISPTIFGGIFESTLNPETRRSGGMHYTSPENIHKVIDPLFLDDLKAEFASIRDDEEATPRKKKNELQRFHKKLCSLKFLDPACGSGNFLTETYICLRKLEDSVLNELQQGQTGFGFGDDEEQGKRISLNQFYGIEINDFAVSVAETALWISRLKANGETTMFYEVGDDDFPLHESAHIVEGNALRMDWNEVLPVSECSYIMGNPPFYGARMQSKEQKAEILDAFHGAKNSGNIDYVAGWYIKAAEYMAGWRIRTAFVSTNSICQGEQVANIWKPIYDLGVHIDFAHDTFRWRNEASDQAHVYVVIVGFSKLGGKKTLFHHANPDAVEVVSNPSNINAYLSTAPDVFMWNRSKPLCNVPELLTGSQRIDDNNYVFTNEEKEAFCISEPAAEQYFKVWYGADEFINNRPRWCLYLGECSDDELAKMPLCSQRVSNVRAYRESSNRSQTKRVAATPKRFGLEVIPNSSFLIVPVVSSERRAYVPLGYMSPEVLCSNQVNLIPDTTLFHFGILHSQFHNAWMRVVCGRLKSDYRYSKGVVYNNFVWPDPTDEQRERIEQYAQAILDARGNYPDKSLADLYDPDKMPADLLEAHKALDAAVEAAYGVDFGGDEEKIVAHLFKLYAEKTAGEQDKQ